MGKPLKMSDPRKSQETGHGRRSAPLAVAWKMVVDKGCVNTGASPFLTRGMKGTRCMSRSDIETHSRARQRALDISRTRRVWSSNAFYHSQPSLFVGKKNRARVKTDYIGKDRQIDAQHCGRWTGASARRIIIARQLSVPVRSAVEILGRCPHGTDINFKSA